MHASASCELAARLLVNGCLREGLAERWCCTRTTARDEGFDDAGGDQNLGVMPSFSRPRVSNDNAYAESLFRTAKYCPLWPEKPFDTLAEARAWVQRFIQWYNDEPVTVASST